MRVLQINVVCGVGSTGRIVTDIQRGIEAQGHQGYVIYGRGPVSPDGTHLRIGSRAETYTHVGLTRLLDRHGFGSKKATRKLVHEVEKLHPDVIHLHNLHGYYLNVEVLFDYLKRIAKPIVWTLHDCWAFTGHCAYFDYVDCTRWRTGCFFCPQKREYPASFLLDNSRYNYARKKRLFSELANLSIVTPSNWLAGLVKDSFLGRHPVTVINNGVDLQTFRPVESSFRSRYRIGNKFVVVGVASAWTRRKGLDYLIELSKLLDETAVTVIVGLTKRQRNALPDGVVGIVRTQSVDELVEVYSSADVFVNPTLEDNFPSASLEAMACGTPVVVFDSGGAAECVSADCGSVVQRGDLAGLLQAIRVIATNGKAAFSEHCRNHVNELFSRDLMVARYLDHYRKVIDDRSD